jgi:hypothetical protein
VRVIGDERGVPQHRGRELPVQRDNFALEGVGGLMHWFSY